MENKPFLIRPCSWVYLFLMMLTVATWAVGKSGLSGYPISMLVLFFALLKGHMIGDYFMGLKGIQGFWRWIIFIWLFIPGGLIATAFWISRAPS